MCRVYIVLDTRCISYQSFNINERLVICLEIEVDNWYRLLNQIVFTCHLVWLMDMSVTAMGIKIRVVNTMKCVCSASFSTSINQDISLHQRKIYGFQSSLCSTTRTWWHLLIKIYIFCYNGSKVWRYQRGNKKP